MTSLGSTSPSARKSSSSESSLTARCFRSFISDWFTVMRNQPGREFGISSEVTQVLVSLQEGFLNRVLGVFPVMRDALSDSEKFAIVSLYELLESSNVPVLAGMDKIQVIVCHCRLRIALSLRS